MTHDRDTDGTDIVDRLSATAATCPVAAEAAAEIRRLRTALAPFRECDSRRFEYLLSVLPRREEGGRFWIAVIDEFRPVFAGIGSTLRSQKPAKGDRR